MRARVGRTLAQRTKDKNKLYALHAPEVECIAKGEARIPYEFGVKVSIATTHREGLVVGTLIHRRSAIELLIGHMKMDG